MVSEVMEQPTKQMSGRAAGQQRECWGSVAHLAVVSQPLSQRTRQQVCKTLPASDELPTNEHQAVEYYLVNMHFLEGRQP